MKRYWPGGVLLACAILAATATFPAEPTASSPTYTAIPDGKIKVPLPDVQQPDNFSCGAAALMSILAYYGLPPEDYDALQKKLGTTKKDGTEYRRIIKLARELRLRAQTKTEMTLRQLEKCLDNGKPVICAIQAWEEGDKSRAQRRKTYEEKDDNGHYVVAIGYDRHNVYFMDPMVTGHRGYLPRGEFEERWHDNEGTMEKPKRVRHLGLVIWKESGAAPYGRRARRID